MAGYLSKGDTKKFITHFIKEDQDFGIIADVQYAVAGRVSEVVGGSIKVRDVKLIDPKNPYIVVKNLKQRSKNNKKREVPISATLGKRLAAYIKKHDLKPSSSMFSVARQTFGRHLTAVKKTFAKKYKLCSASCPLQKLSSHSLRRSACTHMWLDGNCIMAICEISGHSDPSRLLKYIQVNTSAKRKCTKSLNLGVIKLA